MKESTNPVRMHIQKMKNQPTTNQVQGVDLLGQNKGGSYVVVVNSSISSRSSYYELPAGLLAEATHESNKFGAEAPIQKGNHIMTENKVSGSTNSTPTSAFEFTQVGWKGASQICHIVTMTVFGIAYNKQHAHKKRGRRHS